MADTFWRGSIPSKDDFGKPITDEFVDGRTKMGPWAIMNPESFAVHGDKLGWGFGQRYKKVTLAGGGADWKCVEGSHESNTNSH